MLYAAITITCASASVREENLFSRLSSSSQSLVVSYLESNHQQLFLLGHLKKAVSLQCWRVVELIRAKWKYATIEEAIDHIFNLMPEDIIGIAHGLPYCRPQFSQLYRVCLGKLEVLFEKTLLSTDLSDYRPYKIGSLLASFYKPGPQYLIESNATTITVSLDTPNWTVDKQVSLTADGLFARITDSDETLLHFVHIPSGISVACSHLCDYSTQWFPSIRAFHIGPFLLLGNHHLILRPFDSVVFHHRLGLLTLHTPSGRRLIHCDYSQTPLDPRDLADLYTEPSRKTICLLTKQQKTSICCIT